jgi:hypothetical protein
MDSGDAQTAGASQLSTSSNKPEGVGVSIHTQAKKRRFFLGTMIKLFQINLERS